MIIRIMPIKLYNITRTCLNIHIHTKHLRVFAKAQRTYNAIIVLNKKFFDLSLWSKEFVLLMYYDKIRHRHSQYLQRQN